MKPGASLSVPAHSANRWVPEIVIIPYLFFESTKPFIHKVYLHTYGTTCGWTQFFMKT